MDNDNINLGINRNYARPLGDVVRNHINEFPQEARQWVERDFLPKLEGGGDGENVGTSGVNTSRR